MTYINSYIDFAKVYGHFCHDTSLESLKDFPEVEPIKATMSDEEIISFLNVERIGNECIESHRTWTLFFSILAFTGMRPGEVAHLMIDDVDWGRSVFVLRDTKINEPRVVPIPPNVFISLKRYISTLKTNYLFPSRFGGNHNGDGAVFDNVDWHYQFHKRINRMGLRRKNLTVYSLRHSLITRLLEENVNLFTVQKIVGHHDIKTTAHYTHLSTKDMQEAIRKHPIVRKDIDPKDKLKIMSEIIKGFGMEQDHELKYAFTETDTGLSLDVEIKKEGTL